jgi:hypothetical protein
VIELDSSLSRSAGQLTLPELARLHRRVAIAADSEAKSVNSWIADALEAATTPRRFDGATKNGGGKPGGGFRGRSSRSRVSKAEAAKGTSGKKKRAAARKSTR